MIQKMKLSKFWKLSLGLLFFGIAQRLFYTGAVSPWAKDRDVPILLIVLSLVALVLIEEYAVNARVVRGN